MSSANDLRSMFKGMLSLVLDGEVKIERFAHTGGGCIHRTVKVETDRGDFFIKWNELAYEDMFEKEAAGLDLLATTGGVSAPLVLGTGNTGNTFFLVMEYLDSNGPAGNYWSKLGEDLSSLHRCSADRYGLDHNNYIGRLPQSNEWMDSWIDFFIHRRLDVQLDLALYNGHIDPAYADRFRRLYPKLPALLPELPPSLLHGDLWSGNVHCGPDGYAWFIDPAVYYGSREMELAFTMLFGGFGSAFYEAYRAGFPLEPDFSERADLYNLYPLLVHVNLFGKGYLSGIGQTLKRHV